MSELQNETRYLECVVENKNKEITALQAKVEALEGALRMAANEYAIDALELDPEYDNNYTAEVDKIMRDWTGGENDE